MSKLAESLKKGIQAAKSYDKNQQQVEDIFDELNLAIKNFTKNKVQIIKGPNNLKAKDPVSLINHTKDHKVTTRKNGSIFLYSSDSKKIDRIADWHQTDSDFSFSIIYDDTQVIIDSIDQLKVALGELLESPTVGLTLLKHTKSKAKSAPVRTSRANTKPVNQASKPKELSVKDNIKSSAKPATTKPSQRLVDASKKGNIRKRSNTKKSYIKNFTVKSPFNGSYKLEYVGLSPAEDIIDGRRAEA